MFKLSLFLLLVFYMHNSSCFFDDLDDVAKLVWNLYSTLDKIILNNNASVERLSHIFIAGNVVDEEIKGQMNDIFKKVDEIERFMYPEKISDSLKLLSNTAIQHASVTKLELCIQSIDSSYNEFKKYMNGEIGNSDDELNRLVGKITADTEGAITLIRKLVIEENPSLMNHKNIIEAIAADAVLLRDESCDGPQLITSFLAQLLRMVLMAEMKMNFMVLIADTHQYWRHRGPFCPTLFYDHYFTYYSVEIGWHEMILFSEAQFKKHFASYVNVFTLNMGDTESVYLRTCGPVNGTWIHDVHFDEAKETIQTTILSHNGEQCNTTSCSDVSSPKSQKCILKDHNQRISCSFTIADCFDLRAIETCVLRNGPKKFQYMNSTKLGILGTNLECSGDNSYIVKYESTCACNCYGDDNKISLSPIHSEIESNWVITGLRFFRYNKTLYIQPKEGRLLANGYISRNDQRWIPIPEDPQVQTIDRDNRIFFLDDLHLPPYHALTGIKFNKVNRGTVTGFAIQIFGIPFNYKSGRCLFLSYSQMPVKGSNLRAGTAIEFPKVPPNHAHVPYTPYPAAFHYVSLERSELSADFGQSTLPFFDILPILPSPPSILGGIGIFYKGANDSAGFISLRVFPIRYTKYLLDYQREAIENDSVFFDPPEHH